MKRNRLVRKVRMMNSRFKETIKARLQGLALSILTLAFVDQALAKILYKVLEFLP